MDPPKGAPVRGQGERLPDFPYEAQWIHKPRMFLYRPPTQRSLGPLEMIPVVNADKPDWSFGINAMQSPWQLRVGSEDLNCAAEPTMLVLAAGACWSRELRNGRARRGIKCGISG